MGKSLWTERSAADIAAKNRPRKTRAELEEERMTAASLGMPMPEIPPDLEEEASGESIGTRAEKKKNWITKSKYFKKACWDVFQAVDFDKSGSVGETEAYVAVLLFYSKASSLAKGLTPPPFKDVQKIVRTVDKDQSGSIDIREFEALCIILMEHLTGRVLLQIAMSFLIVPVAAGWLVRFFYTTCVKDTAAEWVYNFSIVTQLMSSVIIMTAVPLALNAYEKQTRATLKKKLEAAEAATQEDIPTKAGGANKAEVAAKEVEAASGTTTTKKAEVAAGTKKVEAAAKKVAIAVDVNKAEAAVGTKKTN